MNEPQFLKFCNGCGKFYRTDDPAPPYIFDTHDDAVGVLEFCTKECFDEWTSKVPHH